jgi:WD40 repeat protein
MTDTNTMITDDFMARVYSISTGERVHAWQPHEDYIRSITVHPTLPIILTASDDCTIKSWDWDKAWRCTQVRFVKGHPRGKRDGSTETDHGNVDTVENRSMPVTTTISCRSPS